MLIPIKYGFVFRLLMIASIGLMGPAAANALGGGIMLILVAEPLL
jgi:hypothetical protein